MESITRWIAAASSFYLMVFSQWAATEGVPEVTSAVESQASYDQLYVRVNRAYAPEVTAAVAEVGRPVARRIKSGDTFRSVTLALCGHIDAVYSVAFMKENSISPSKVGALDEGKIYLFPACLWNSNSSYEVKDGEFPSQIYSKLNIPFAGALVEKPDGLDQSPLGSKLQQYVDVPQITREVVEQIARDGRGFTAAEMARTFSQLNPGLKSTELNKSGQTIIKTPEQRLSGVISVRKSIELSKAISTLELALKSVPVPPAGTELYGEANQILTNRVGELETASLISHIKDDGPCDWADGTPFSIDELRKAREENARLRGSASNEVTVLFLDTGYDARLGEPAIKKADLGSIRAYRDDDTQQGLFGFNPLIPELYRDATPPDNLPSRMHGSEVAATFLGGSFIPEEDRSNNPAKIVFASIAQRNELKAEGAAFALNHAADEKIQIVNASFVARSDSASFLASLKLSRPPLLLIAAAGNVPGNPTEFDSDDRSWPGRLGGSHADVHLPWVILSVGAHGPNKERLWFSRTGASSVDLLAPGCNIPTYTLDDNGAVIKIKRNGTSYAAPLVTMVAAEMVREGMKSYQVRNRLIYSVDVDRDLDGVVRSSGTLNLRKALSIYRDIVEVNEEDPLTKKSTTRWISGTLKDTTDSIICQNETLKYSALLKFASAGKRSTPNSRKHLYVWTRPASKDSPLMQSKRCEQDDVENAPPLKIHNAATNQFETIPLINVIDFVARTYSASTPLEN